MLKIAHIVKVFVLIRLSLMVVLRVVFAPANAQSGCGVVESISFPVDPNVFVIAQDFGVSSQRHGGRYHTAEDWYGGRDSSYGTPVRAIAPGGVTYSYPLGWGRDGGVVILEHTFPDGTIAYSQYGHMEETDQYPFPEKFACVRQGDVVGKVGNARPAPHVHFEIHLNRPDDPGAGYTWEDPTTVGYVRPSQFVLNWQGWLQPSHRWHLILLEEAGPISPPLELPDHSLLYMDAGRIRGVMPDGRVLWRINLDRPAVSLTPFEEDALLTYADGGMQRVNLGGSLAESWETGVPVDGAPIVVGESLIFHAPDDRLVAFGADRQTVMWQLADVPPIVHSRVGGQVIGLITQNNEMLTLSHDGQLLDRAQLRDRGSLEIGLDGELLAYTFGGLWNIAANGEWTTVMENAPAGGDNRAVTLTDDGTLYLLNADEAANASTLYAYDRDLNPLWQTALPYMPGMTELDSYDAVLLITGNHGYVIAMQEETGAMCGMNRIYGDRRARVWHSLGDDGILRVAVADQILGLDWRELLGGCV